MRIIGLKRGQLPYYCYDEHKDYIAELAEHKDLVTAKQQLYHVDITPSSITCTIYHTIDKTTMLYKDHIAY